MFGILTNFYPAVISVWNKLLIFHRFCGSYELLHASPLSEVLTLLTGGLVELFNFRNELPDDMFDILHRALLSESIIACSMEVCLCVL